MSNKYSIALHDALSNKKINSYMFQKLLKTVNSGMDDSIFNNIISDAQNASDLNINSDEQYNNYFYMCHFLDDILKDTFDIKLNDNGYKNSFCKYFLNKKAEIKDLTNLRLLVHEWLCSPITKVAYPNIGGKYNRSPVYNINKWSLIFQHASNAALVGGINQDTAIDDMTKDWDDDERNSFKNWIKYYQENNTEKYNVKTAKFIKEAFGPIHVNLPENLLNNRNVSAPQFSTFQANDNKTKKELEIDKAKSLKTKMKSRIRALKMLMDKYNDILPHQDLDKLFTEINSLEKSISKLNVHASIKDRIVCSANRMTKLGFSEGAELLLKEADDVAVPPEALKPAPSSISSGNVNVQNIIAKLEVVSKSLSSRDLIRSLAAADILLNEIGMAAIFPELSLAQSKLIEGFGYASNKVEDVLARLRGTGKTQLQEPSPLPTAPMPQPAAVAVKPEEKIQTEELMDKPVGKIETTMPTNAVPKK